MELRPTAIEWLTELTRRYLQADPTLTAVGFEVDHNYVAPWGCYGATDSCNPYGYKTTLKVVGTAKKYRLSDITWPSRMRAYTYAKAVTLLEGRTWTEDLEEQALDPHQEEVRRTSEAVLNFVGRSSDGFVVVLKDLDGGTDDLKVYWHDSQGVLQSGVLHPCPLRSRALR